MAAAAAAAAAAVAGAGTRAGAVAGAGAGAGSDGSDSPLHVTVTNSAAQLDCGRSSNLRAFVPELVCKELVFQNPQVWCKTELAVVALMDISGFTPLTERLAKRGHKGMEELSDVLNRFFSVAIDTIHEHGGDVIKFAGDALLILFRRFSVEAPHSTGNRSRSSGNNYFTGRRIKRDSISRRSSIGQSDWSVRLSSFRIEAGSLHSASSESDTNSRLPEFRLSLSSAGSDSNGQQKHDSSSFPSSTHADHDRSGAAPNASEGTHSQSTSFSHGEEEQKQQKQQRQQQEEGRERVEEAGQKDVRLSFPSELVMEFPDKSTINIMPLDMLDTCFRCDTLLTTDIDQRHTCRHCGVLLCNSCCNTGVRDASSGSVFLACDVCISTSKTLRTSDMSSGIWNTHITREANFGPVPMMSVESLVKPACFICDHKLRGVPSFTEANDLTKTGREWLNCACCGVIGCKVCIKIPCASTQASSPLVCRHCAGHSSRINTYGEENIRDTAARAVHCALDLRQQLDGYQSLRLHIGIGVGTTHMLQLGGILDRWEVALAGPSLEDMAAAENESKVGEICMSSSAWSLVSSKCQRDCVRKPSGVSVVGGLREPPAALPVVTRHSARADMNNLYHEARLLAYVPGAIHEALSQGRQMKHLASLRRASILFIGFPDIDASTEKNLLIQKLQTSLTMVQTALYELEGMLRQFIVDDKGTVAICVFGIDPAHENDPELASICATRCIRNLSSADIGCQIGAATGAVFGGLVGSVSRCEYAIVGDVVNLAARLMGIGLKNRSLPKLVCDRATYVSAKAHISFESLGSVSVKGKSDAVRIFTPSELYSNAAAKTVADGLVPGPVPRNVLCGSSHQLSLGILLRCTHLLLESSRGAVVMLDGPLGSGKSTVLKSYMDASSAMLEGIPRTNFVADQTLSRFKPFSAFTKVIEECLTQRTIPAEDSSAAGGKILLSDDGMRLAALAVFVGQHHLVSEEQLQELSQLSRERHYALIHTAILDRLRGLGPRILVIDGVQALDDHSHQMLLDLTMAISDNDIQLLLILTHRSVDHEMAQGFSRHQSTGSFSMITDQLGTLPTDTRSYLGRSRSLVGPAREGKSDDATVVMTTYSDMPLVCQALQKLCETSASEMHWLTLAPLTRSETKELVQVTLSMISECPLPLLSLVYERAFGNPLYTVEYTRLFEESAGAIDFGRGDAASAIAQLAQQIKIPENLAGVVTSRVDKLSDSSKWLLQFMSVIGKSTTVSILRQVVEIHLAEHQEQDFQSDLDVLKSTQFIFVSQPGAQIRFVSDLLQEAVYSTISYSIRKKLHGSVARVLQHEWDQKLRATVQYRDDAWYKMSATKQRGSDSSHIRNMLAHHYWAAEKYEEAAHIISDAMAHYTRLHMNSKEILQLHNTILGFSVNAELSAAVVSANGAGQNHPAGFIALILDAVVSSTDAGMIHAARWFLTIGEASFLVGKYSLARAHLMRVIELLSPDESRPTASANDLSADAKQLAPVLKKLDAAGLAAAGGSLPEKSHILGKCFLQLCRVCWIDGDSGAGFRCSSSAIKVFRQAGAATTGLAIALVWYVIFGLATGPGVNSAASPKQTLKMYQRYYKPSCSMLELAFRMGSRSGDPRVMAQLSTYCAIMCAVIGDSEGFETHQQQTLSTISILRDPVMNTSLRLEICLGKVLSGQYVSTLNMITPIIREIGHSRLYNTIGLASSIALYSQARLGLKRGAFSDLAGHLSLRGYVADSTTLSLEVGHQMFALYGGELNVPRLEHLLFQLLQVEHWDMKMALPLILALIIACTAAGLAPTYMALGGLQNRSARSALSRITSFRWTANRNQHHTESQALIRQRWFKCGFGARLVPGSEAYGPDFHRLGGLIPNLMTKLKMLSMRYSVLCPQYEWLSGCQAWIDNDPKRARIHWEKQLQIATALSAKYDMALAHFELARTDLDLEGSTRTHNLGDACDICTRHSFRELNKMIQAEMRVSSIQDIMTTLRKLEPKGEGKSRSSVTGEIFRREPLINF